MKKIITIILSIILVLAMSLPTAAITAVKPKATPAPKIKPVTFKMYSVEMNAYPDNFASPVARAITKATGVNLQIEYAVSSDAGKQRLSLMAASGDYPDIVYGKGDMNILYNVKGLLKLDKYIDKSPNIKAFYGDQLKRLKWSKEDPGIYLIGGKEVGQENMEPNAGFQLQHKVVKELGYPKMKTLQDFEAAIKNYVEKHPTTADGQKTLGLSLLADDWRFLITVSNPANFARGGSDDGEWSINQKDYSVMRHLLEPEEKEYFRWLNHMNAIGLLDPESFVQKYDQYKAKIASGRVVALADARWEIDEPVAALKKAGKLEDCYGYYPVTMKDGVKFADFVSTGYLGGWGMGITTKAKDPERIMKFFDWMCTEKAQILTHWGLEGVNYDIKNGKRVMRQTTIDMKNNDPQFPKKSGIITYCYPFPTYGNSVKDSKGQYYEAFNTLESIISRQTPIENEVLKGYGVRAWKELYPQASDFPVKKYGAGWVITIDDPEWRAIDTKVQQAGYKLIPAAILAKPDDFDAAYDKYVKEIKAAGVDSITKTYEKALKERVEMWK